MADASNPSLDRADPWRRRRHQEHRRSARRCDLGRPVPGALPGRTTVGAPRHRRSRVWQDDQGLPPEGGDRLWRADPARLSDQRPGLTRDPCGASRPTEQGEKGTRAGWLVWLGPAPVLARTRGMGASARTGVTGATGDGGRGRECQPLPAMTARCRWLAGQASLSRLLVSAYGTGISRISSICDEMIAASTGSTLLGLIGPGCSRRSGIPWPRTCDLRLTTEWCDLDRP